MGFVFSHKNISDADITVIKIMLSASLNNN